jgi:Na+/H+ antiporter NhaA
VQTALGGFAGGAVGTVLGMAIGAAVSQGCHGEFCELPGIVLGMSLGESIGLATGANIASRSHRPERIVLTSLASVGILAGGAFASKSLSRRNVNAGAIMTPIIPALQLAAAVAIESH